MIFYLAISLLIAAVFTYLIFLAKNSIQRQQIREQISALETVGTKDQKDQEKEVLSYQKKLNDFADIFKNHEFASNVFAFMQAQTMPNIWFKQFALNRQEGNVQLSGETDNLEALSRQVANFEKNKYVKNLAGLNSSLGQSARTQFSFSLSLDSQIFDYLSDVGLPPAQPAQASSTQEALPPVQQAEEQAQAGQYQKLITSFHLLLNPEIVGQVDQTNLTVKLDVPFGTDVKNLMPSIVISPNAAVIPASSVAQDFSNPITYKVVSPDGTSQEYKVTVNVLPNPVQPKKSNTGALIGLIVMAIAIVVLAVVVLVAWKKLKSKKQSLNI